MKQPAAAYTSWDERIAGPRGNAFDAIRLVLASAVVLNHSYFLRINSSQDDPLYVLSGGQVTFGSVAVAMFFSLSGYLVTRSYLESQSCRWFLARRIARIMPGFLAATMIGCLVFGPLAATDSGAYFREQRWHVIAIGALALKPFSISGVLADNPLAMMQGTFWTIQYEFNCYLLIAALGILGLLRTPQAYGAFAVLALACVAAVLMKPQLPEINHGPLALLVSSPDRWGELVPFFVAGSAFYVFRERIPKSGALAFLAAVVLLVTFATGGAVAALVFCGTYLLLFTALSTKGETRIAGRRIDLSYGIYLYGWPVQQMLIHWFGTGMSAITLFALSMALTAVVALLSWLAIEQPALALVRDQEARSRPRTVATA